MNVEGTKHDKRPQQKPGKLAEDPAMMKLARMIEAGEVDAERTVEYVKQKGRP